MQGASNSEVWLRQVIFFSLWVGRVAPLFSGEDTVQGKEEKRVKKKKETLSYVSRPPGPLEREPFCGWLGGRSIDLGLSEKCDGNEGQVSNEHFGSRSRRKPNPF